MDELRTPEVIAFWTAYCSRQDVDADQRWDVFAFGDSPDVADRLAQLVLLGPKRATTGLLRFFEPPAGATIPEVGAYSVVVGGSGEPLAVIRTTEVAVKPMNEVDDAFAWDEGEGDRSLAYWVDAHRRYFTRELAALGVEFTDDMPVVLERFALMWPVQETAAS